MSAAVPPSVTLVGNVIQRHHGPDRRTCDLHRRRRSNRSRQRRQKRLECGLNVYPYTTTRDTCRRVLIGNTIDGGAGKVWAKSTYFNLSDYLYISTPPAYTSGHLSRCIVAGTSGGTTPSWPSTLGEKVVDGGVTWKNVGTSKLGVGSGIELAGPSDSTHYGRGYRASRSSPAAPTPRSPSHQPSPVCSIADAHRGDGKRFVVHADEILTAFVELESAVRVVAY